MILWMPLLLQAQTSDQLAKMEWLLGNWNRTNAKPGRTGVEIWSKKSDNELTGRGIAMKGVDTVFVEKLKIIHKDKKCYYVADVAQNKSEVFFEITSINDKGFVCENPNHDFPKKIEYRLEGGQLKATISGNGRAIDYLFEKK